MLDCSVHVEGPELTERDRMAVGSQSLRTAGDPGAPSQPHSTDEETEGWRRSLAAPWAAHRGFSGIWSGALSLWGAETLSSLGWEGAGHLECHFQRKLPFSDEEIDPQAKLGGYQSLLSSI